jgi:phage terminase large subunit
MKVEERALYEALPDLWVQTMSGEIPWEKQREIMQAVVRYPRVAVASANSCGKTFIAARLAAWFLCPYSHSMVITTAPTDRQVSEIFWREVRTFYAKARAHGHSLGGKLFQTCRWEFSEDHFAIGFSTNDSDPAKFQGFHGRHVMVIADEAAGISEKIFEGITAVLKGAHSRLLAIGNPTTLDGWFYEAFKSEGWHSFHISAFDTPNVTQGRIVTPGLVTRADIEQARIDYGDGSSVYQARVLGQFPDRLDDTMIPIRWVEEAGEREPPREGEVVIGADIARGGNDSTVFVARCGMNAFVGEEYKGIDTMESSGRLLTFCKKVKATRAQIDVVGLGAEVVDRLKELMPELEVVEMSAGKKAHDDEHYANAGAEWYAGLSEILRDQRAGGAVFKNKRVIGELTSRKRRMRSDGRYELEPKHEAQKRGARSPDWGDAVAMCFAPQLKTGPEAYIEEYLNWAEQRQRDNTAPTKLALNRQTGAIELVSRTRVAPTTQPPQGSSRPKTVFELYQESLKKQKERLLDIIRIELCKNCGKQIAQFDHQVTDGFDLWHRKCPS